MAVEGRYFRPHQPEGVDGEALFGFAQFGRKQPRERHLEGQIDNGVVLGGNGQQQLINALFFEQLDKVRTYLARFARKKGLKNPLPQGIFHARYEAVVGDIQALVAGLGIHTAAKVLKFRQLCHQMRGNVHRHLLAPDNPRCGQRALCAVPAFHGQSGFVAGCVFFVQAQKQDAACFEIALDDVRDVADVHVAVGVDEAVHGVF